MIAIVDYGMVNVGPIRNMLATVGSDAVITARANIQRADKVVLLDVGRFDAGMRNLVQSELIPALKEAAMVPRVPVGGRRCSWRTTSPDPKSRAQITHRRSRCRISYTVLTSNSNT